MDLDNRYIKEAREKSRFPQRVHISLLTEGDVVVMLNKGNEPLMDEFNEMRVTYVSPDQVHFMRPTILRQRAFGPFEVHVEDFWGDRGHSELFYRIISRE